MFKKASVKENNNRFSHNNVKSKTYYSAIVFVKHQLVVDKSKASLQVIVLIRKTSY